MNHPRTLFSGVWLFWAIGTLYATEPGAPNLIVEVHQRLLDAAPEPIDRTEPVRDRILGTDIFSCAHSLGRVRVQFVPCAHRAAFDLEMEAHVESPSRGFNGPARILSTGHSNICARKRVYFDVNGLTSEPAVSANRTDVSLHRITTKFEGPVLDGVVTKLAYRRYHKLEEKARRIAQSHVDDRVRESFDRDAGQELAKGNQSYCGKLRAPLEQRRLFPEVLHARTSTEWLHVIARLSDDRTPAVSPAPAVPSEADLAVRLHHSMLDVGGERLLGGQTYTEERVRRELAELLGPAASALAPPTENRNEKATLSFPPQRPVSYTFEADHARIELRTTKIIIERPDEDEPLDFGRVTIRVGYRLGATARGFKVTRDGPVEVEMPDVKGATSRVTYRRILQRRLAEAFPESAELEELKLPEDARRFGPLVPAGLHATNGWLVLGLRREG